MHADDTTLSSTLPNIKNSRDQIIAEQLINTELNKIDVWLRCNKLSLNISTTKYMLYSMPQKQTPHMLTRSYQSVCQHNSTKKIKMYNIFLVCFFI